MNIFKLGDVIVENLGDMDINNQQYPLSVVEYSDNFYISSSQSFNKYPNYKTLYIEKSNNLGLSYHQDSSFVAKNSTYTNIDNSTPRNLVYGHLRVHFKSGYTTNTYICVKCTDGSNITHLASVLVIDYLSDNVVFSEVPMIRDGVVYDKYVDIPYYKLHGDNSNETADIQSIIPGNITSDIHVSVYKLSYYSNVGVYRYYSKNSESATPLIEGYANSGSLYSVISDKDDYVEFSIGHNTLDVNQIIFAASAAGGNFSILHEISVREYTSEGSFVTTSNMTHTQRSVSIPVKLVPVVELANTISVTLIHRVSLINSTTGISAFADGTITIDPAKYKHRQVLAVSPISPMVISPAAPQSVVISNDNQITGVVNTNTYVFLTSHLAGDDITINNHVSNVVDLSILSDSTSIGENDEYKLMISSSSTNYIQYIDPLDVSVSVGSSSISLKYIIDKSTTAKIYTNSVDTYNVVLISSGIETSVVSGGIIA